MANLLHFISGHGRIAPDLRAKAGHVAEQWDSIAKFRLNNPIVAVRLEEWFFPEEK